MRNLFKYRLIAAISTAVIVALIYFALNFNFLPFSSIVPPKMEERQLDISLDQMMEDLADLIPPENEKETPKPETQKPTPQNQVEAAEKEAEQPKTEAIPPTERDENIIMQQETIARLKPLKVEPLKVVEKPEIDSIIPEEIIKIIKEQNLAQNRPKVQRKYLSQAEREIFYRKNYKAIYNLMKVYPYAIRTREIIDSLNTLLAATDNKREQKRMIDETEKKLFSQYETAVRNMSTSQGRVLLKLIARETNKSGYDLIKQFKGGFTATFWYSVGKLFKTDLKTTYNKDEDSIYEEIIDRYENGEYIMIQKNVIRNRE